MSLRPASSSPYVSINSSPFEQSIMAATNANEPKLTVQFSGTGVAKDLTRVSLCDGQILFPLLPLGKLVTSLGQMRGTTFPSVWSQDPALSVKCRATLRSGDTELNLFIKVVLHLEAGEQSLQFDAANDLPARSWFLFTTPFRIPG
jgi:hypothetical protein